MRIRFKGKKRSPSEYSTDGKSLFLNREWEMQNEIERAKQRTQARACFRGCNTCGACANSRRDATYPKEYDNNAGKLIDCRKCEPFRFHDCHNGWLRNARQEAEPFTEEMTKLIEEGPGGRPLI